LSAPSTPALSSTNTGCTPSAPPFAQAEKEKAKELDSLKGLSAKDKVARLNKLLEKSIAYKDFLENKIKKESEGIGCTPSAPPFKPLATVGAPTAEELRVGALVRVKGLNGRPELNGLCGVVVEPRTANGRWPVHMLPSGARVALLAERLTIEAPCSPSPSKSELEAQNELVSLVTLLAGHGPRCIRFCTQACGVLFRRASNGLSAQTERASLARLPVAAVLSMCLEVHAMKIKLQVANWHVGECLTSICMLISKLPPRTVCQSRLPQVLCARLHEHIKHLDGERDAAFSGGDGPNADKSIDCESCLAIDLATTALPAIYSFVFDEASDVHPDGAQALCAADGVAIVVRFLVSSSNAFADTLPTSLTRLADMSVRRFTSLISRTVERAFGPQEDGSDGDGQASAQQTMVLSLVFSQLRTSLKLLGALADSGPGADAVLAAGAFDASAIIVDWYPEDKPLVDRWKGFMSRLCEHRPARHSKLMVNLCSDGLKSEDESLHRPTASLIIQHMVETHGDEIRECLQRP
jgi:hypothetical protein